MRNRRLRERARTCRPRLATWATTVTMPRAARALRVNWKIGASVRRAVLFDELVISGTLDHGAMASWR